MKQHKKIYKHNKILQFFCVCKESTLTNDEFHSNISRKKIIKINKTRKKKQSEEYNLILNL
jgi:hypothetical protein